MDNADDPYKILDTFSNKVEISLILPMCINRKNLRKSSETGWRNEVLEIKWLSQPNTLLAIALINARKSRSSQILPEIQ